MSTTEENSTSKRIKMTSFATTCESTSYDGTQQ